MKRSHPVDFRPSAGRLRRGGGAREGGRWRWFASLARAADGPGHLGDRVGRLSNSMSLRKVAAEYPQPSRSVCCREAARSRPRGREGCSRCGPRLLSSPGAGMPPRPGPAMVAVGSGAVEDDVGVVDALRAGGSPRRAGGKPSWAALGLPTASPLRWPSRPIFRTRVWRRTRGAASADSSQRDEVVLAEFVAGRTDSWETRANGPAAQRLDAQRRDVHPPRREEVDVPPVGDVRGGAGPCRKASPSPSERAYRAASIPTGPAPRTARCWDIAGL